MFLVDSHCHLDMQEFAGDLDQVVANAVASGVKYMQTICTRLDNFPNVLGVAEKYDNIFCSVGVHPHEIDLRSIPSAEELIKLSEHPKVIGLGETGLDYYYETSVRDAQIESFRNHIIAARETGLPVIIHSRSADEDMIKILKEEQVNGKFSGLIHCFTSTKNLAEVVIELDMYISVSGIITFKNAKDLQGIIKEIPLSRIIVETDAPYLAPTPMRGKRCEPAFTKHTAEFLADLKAVSLEEVVSSTTENFKKLFNKAILL
ncbi:MAG: yabD [Rickettsiaceae bacterium]|jgi:TatD DNase family protein|nr:yabD [Rickettsiaceae bacterium]